MKLLTKKEYIEDLEAIIPYLEEVHPNPFFEITKEKVFFEIENAKLLYKEPFNLLDFYLIVSPIISMLKDGHTGLYFPISTFEELDFYIFPYRLKFTNNYKCFIIDKQNDIPINSEIISIDNRSINEIISSLLPLIGGENEHFRLDLLSGMFNSLYSAVYKNEGSYTIEYMKKNKIEKRILKGTKWLKFKTTNLKKKDKSYYSYKILDNNIAYLDFKNFLEYEQFVPFINKMIKDIKDKNCNNLIIDLRKNGGGNSELGKELFKYISKTPFCQFGKTLTKYSEKRKDLYLKYRKDQLAYLEDKVFSKLIEGTFGDIKIEENKQLTALNDESLRFTGNIFVLTSNYTFSSAADFAYTFKNFKMGKIIGEETGGHIVSFGDIIETYLPNSKMLLFISHQEFYGYNATEKNRHPVYPDIKVDSEKALNFTLNYIKKLKK